MLRTETNFPIGFRSNVHDDPSSHFNNYLLNNYVGLPRVLYDIKSNIFSHPGGIEQLEPNCTSANQFWKLDFFRNEQQCNQFDDGRRKQYYSR